MIFKQYGLVVAVFLAMPAYAQWTPELYKSEYESCVPECDKNNPAAHDKCVSYCRCVTDSMQSTFPDHGRMLSDFEKKVPASFAALQGMANACNHKSFGADTPRKLK
jgi:hypothetical protein